MVVDPPRTRVQPEQMSTEKSVQTKSLRDQVMAEFIGHVEPDNPRQYRMNLLKEIDAMAISFTGFTDIVVRILRTAQHPDSACYLQWNNGAVAMTVADTAIKLKVVSDGSPANGDTELVHLVYDPMNDMLVGKVEDEYVPGAVLVIRKAIEMMNKARLAQTGLMVAPHAS